MTEETDVDNNDWLGPMRQYQPQLTEKALIDLVNGLEVIDDHLRCRANLPPLVVRIWKSVTGKDAQQQNLIDVNMKTGLSALTAWLSDLKAFQTKSDIALTFVAEKLVKTKREIRVQLQDIRVELDKTIDQVGARLNDLSLRVTELESRDNAKTHLELLIARHQKAAMRRLPFLVGVFLAIDELWWGDFGAYCRLTQNADSADQLIELAGHKIAASFSQYAEVGVNQLYAIDDLTKPLREMDADQGACVSYLAGFGLSHRTPLLCSIAEATGGSLSQASPDKLPLAISLSGLANRLFREARMTLLDLKP